MSLKWRTITAMVSVMAYAIAIIAVSVHHPDHHVHLDQLTVDAEFTCDHSPSSKCPTVAGSANAHQKQQLPPADHSDDDCSVCKFAAQPIVAAALGAVLFDQPLLAPTTTVEPRRMAQPNLFSGSPRGPPSLG